MGLLPRLHATALTNEARAVAEQKLEAQRQERRSAQAVARQATREAKKVVTEALSVALDGGYIARPSLTVGMRAQALLEDLGFMVFPVPKGTESVHMPSVDHASYLLRRYRISVQCYMATAKRALALANPGVTDEVLVS